MATRVKPITGTAPGTIVKVPVEVVKTTEGPVSLRQKITGYYKGLIATVGAILTLLATIGPLSHFLPADQQHWLAIAIAVLTGVATFLKENEHWVDYTTAE